MQKVIGYIRVSTTGQVEEGVSLEAQKAKIAAWCALNDGELVALFEDAGISGGGMVKRAGGARGHHQRHGACNVFNIAPGTQYARYA